VCVCVPVFLSRVSSECHNTTFYVCVCIYVCVPGPCQLSVCTSGPCSPMRFSYGLLYICLWGGYD